MRAFHRRLCEVRVLDPACGTANFLYVTLEHMKRLEGEVLTTLHDLGEGQTVLELEGLTVDPHQFLGLEVNPRAAAIADVVLWIGYLQWHFRTRGQVMPPEPVLRPFRNIECRDAVLDWDGTDPVRDDQGQPVTRWDGVTTKPHPVTGEPVPDETARVPVVRYRNPRKAQWPEADFIVGNPPFIGGWRMRQALGDGYVQALWQTYPHMPEKADYVTFWWDLAAEAARRGRIRRFGLITTNSLSQVFQRRVLARHLDADETPLALVFAVPDHLWVESADGAAVRIAMTVGERKDGTRPARLARVTAEGADQAVTLDERLVAAIGADLRSGPNLDAAVPLRANEGIVSPGVQLYGAGFILSADEAAAWPQAENPRTGRGVLRPYLNGRDLMATARGAWVIDFFGLSQEEARHLHPEAFQRVLDRVKPERDQNRRASIQALWWRFGWERPVWREASAGLKRFIATPETAKHRVFVFFDAAVLPDNMLTSIALDDAVFLGVLSSRAHVVWTLAAGARLGAGNDPRYTKGRCFDPFPFPALGRDGSPSRPHSDNGALGESALPDRIRTLAEELDAHRKRQQALHPRLTLTGMYNVLAKLRSGEPLTAAERAVHDQGLVSVLCQLHDELDAAVFAAYGWPPSLTDEEILARLVALNAERAAEEKRGLVRWLRPELQVRGRAGLAPPELAMGEEDRRGEPRPTTSADTAKPSRLPWPKPLPDQAQAVLAALREAAGPATAEEVARSFKGASAAQVADLLETLAALGQARRSGEGRYAAG
ncbi:MAG: DNA methyltransferase [Thermodesulfobacteriota bacterium]